jgi:heat-inducible transcriptional repressor
MARDKQALIEEQGQEAEDLSDLLHQTARLTAVLSGCTAIVRAPRQAGSRIRTLSLLPVGEAEALLVLVTTTGAVSHRLVRLPGATSPEELNLLSNFLGEQLRDRPLDGLTYRVLQDISRDLAKYQAHLEACCERLAIQPANGEQVIVSNTALLAQQPEFSASTKVGSLLSFLEEQEDLTRLMDALAAQEGAPGRARVRIGAENLLPDLQECSLVSATYSVGGELAGEIAVLGPTRLDYSTAIAAVTAMADRLTRALSTRFVP